jgi:hypothetical protein
MPNALDDGDCAYIEVTAFHYGGAHFNEAILVEGAAVAGIESGVTLKFSDCRLDGVYG